MSPLMSDDQMYLRVSPTEFTFRGRSSSLTVVPRVWLDADGKPAGVGEHASREGLTAVDLFVARADDAGERFPLLVYLIRYGLVELISGHVFKLRPVLHVEAADALRPVLSGFEKTILEQAATHAGAKRVVFASR